MVALALAVVIDLDKAQSRRDLDKACRRAGQGKDFVDAMLRLERQAKRRRLAIVYHIFDACFGSSGEDEVINLLWIGGENHCRCCKVIFTDRNPAFVARCFRNFQNCLGFVHKIVFPGWG
jgi:hypothetical protein